ncbi:Cyclin-dependent protein kinase inhibitor SMR14 [Hirschfeldia incana]|nr:Cyclin-dependent protein kinase inhibitor SMR14 [Hirschfeldia incana]
MPDTKIFQLLPDDTDVAAMQSTDSLLVLSKPQPLESSLSPSLQENKSRSNGNGQQQDHEQEKLQYESRSKRKWEYNDETSRVEILETPRNSNIRCYCPPRPPRKPKASPAVKGRAMWLKRSVILLDVSREVESMFPPSVLQDFGKKIKKARH